MERRNLVHGEINPVLGVEHRAGTKSARKESAPKWLPAFRITQLAQVTFYCTHVLVHLERFCEADRRSPVSGLLRLLSQ